MKAVLRITTSLALVVLCLASAFGCTTRIGDFTAISTKNIYAKGINVNALPKAEGVKGSDIRFFGIGANIQKAVEKAQEKGHGNLMIDCAVYRWWATILFMGFEVRGTVVNVPYAKDSTASRQSGS